MSLINVTILQIDTFEYIYIYIYMQFSKEKKNYLFRVGLNNRIVESNTFHRYYLSICYYLLRAQLFYECLYIR